MSCSLASRRGRRTTVSGDLGVTTLAARPAGVSPKVWADAIRTRVSSMCGHATRTEVFALASSSSVEVPMDRMDAIKGKVTKKKQLV